MNLLKGRNQSSINAVLVKLPEWKMEEAVIIRHSGWDEIEPGRWHNYLDLQKTVPEVLIDAMASHWSELQKENATLRAVINGKLQSVPKTFMMILSYHLHRRAHQAITGF